MGQIGDLIMSSAIWPVDGLSGVRALLHAVWRFGNGTTCVMPQQQQQHNEKF